MTLFHEFFDATASRVPTRIALRHRDRELTYGEVRQSSERLASALASSGVQRGDRVVVYLQNRPEVVKVALACSRLGAIFVPANPMLRGRQLTYVLQDSGARVLVLSANALANFAEIVSACPALRGLIVCESQGVVPTADIPAMTFDDALRGVVSLPRCPSIDRDPAAILYTSGSTGRPKGVVVSHRNLVSGAHCVANYLGNVPEDRLLAALPLSFDYGFSQVSTAFAVGACAVLTSFSTAPALIQELATAKITGLAGVPTMWAHLASSEWSDAAAVSIRYITNSGGTLAPAVIKRLQSRLPKASIFCMYGLTEAFRSTYLEPGLLDTRPGSIGKAIPNQEVFVVRPDGGRCLPDEVGELVHRGSLVTLGYWNDPDLTRKRFRPLPPLYPGLVDEIAVWSGDLAKMDADGFFYFVGRNDQQIKTSGNRVSPTDIEEVALEVTGVVEAVAVGIPDPVLGQRIALAIVADPGSSNAVIETVRQHCRMQLPAYMVPSHVCIVASIPRNSNGKQDRAAVLAELHLSATPDSEQTINGRPAR